MKREKRKMGWLYFVEEGVIKKGVKEHKIRGVICNNTVEMGGVETAFLFETFNNFPITT